MRYFLFMPSNLFNEISSMGMKPLHSEFACQFLCLSAIVVAVAIVYWPGLYGFWGRDDYMQLAMARFVESPWPLFFQDHFVASSGTVFRPLGFASLWLGEALFGTDYRSHALFTLGLHAGVCLSLFGVLRVFSIPRASALLGTMLFALHPAVIGTALWWSARFDLLAVLFGLLAIFFATLYRNASNHLYLAICLAMFLAAMLSKEIGLAFLAPLSLIWLHLAWRVPHRIKTAILAVILAWLSAVILLIWRWTVLDTFSGKLGSEVPLVFAVYEGIKTWLVLSVEYLTFWPRLEVLGRAVVISGIVLLGLAVAAQFFRKQVRQAGAEIILVGLCGLSLILLPALLQAPIVRLNAEPLTADMSAVEAAMQSRLFYLTMAGLGMVIGAVLAFVAQTNDRVRKAASFGAIAVMAVAAGVASNHDAREFAQRSQEISEVAREAVAAVGNLELPETGCHVVFLDVPRVREWGIYVSMDSIIKALHPRLEHVGHCFFHADFPTFYYLLGDPGYLEGKAPLLTLKIGGMPIEPLEVSGVVSAYLQFPDQISREQVAHFQVLRYQDGAFVESRVEAGEWRLAPSDAP